MRRRASTWIGLWIFNIRWSWNRSSSKINSPNCPSSSRWNSNKVKLILGLASCNVCTGWGPSSLARDLPIPSDPLLEKSTLRWIGNCRTGRKMRSTSWTWMAPISHPCSMTGMCLSPLFNNWDDQDYHFSQLWATWNILLFAGICYVVKASRLSGDWNSVLSLPMS